MTEDSEICGVDTVYGDGVCEFKGKYSDGKCGIHSEHNENRRQGRKIANSDLRDFLDREKQRITTSTYDTRLTGIRAFDEWVEETNSDPLELGPMSIEDFVVWMQSTGGRNASDGTAAKYVQQVSKFYQYANKRAKEECGIDLYEDNPVHEADLNLRTNDSQMSKKLHDDEGYVAMDPDEFNAFIDHLPAPTARNQLMFHLLWDCGLRPIELTEIRYEDDIDRGNREIQIRSDKTHRNRVVFYGETVATMMEIWLNGGERARFNPAETSPYLFITQQSEKIGTWTIQNVFREAAEAADLYGEPVYIDGADNPKYDIKPYSLRHGFAERMVDEVDIETLRDVMGHENVKTTMKYVNPDKETRRRRIQNALDD